MQFLNKVNIHGPSSCKEGVHIYLSFTVIFKDIERKKPETALRLEIDLGRCPAEIFVILT